MSKDKSRLRKAYKMINKATKGLDVDEGRMMLIAFAGMTYEWSVANCGEKWANALFADIAENGGPLKPDEKSKDNE